MRHRIAALLLSVLTACGTDTGAGPGSEPAAPTPCTSPTARCTAWVVIGDGLNLRYFRSLPLEIPNPGVTRAVIVVHGTNRNADDYFETMVAATRAAGRLESTVVVAPNFVTEGDFPAAGQAYWTSSGWKRGNLSSNGLEPVSSYTGVDRLLEALGDRGRFPDLAVIVVTGHSAGGQYVHRFAAGSRAAQAVTGISVRYVVSNPSSYLYLGPERVMAGTLDAFQMPDRAACPAYNSWHYGLEDLNEYMSALPLGDIQTQLVSRDVVYLLGDADSLSSGLDMSCAANLQGEYRYVRGLTLLNYLNQFYPGHAHSLAIVAGVGHSNREMYTSDMGLLTLFAE